MVSCRARRVRTNSGGGTWWNSSASTRRNQSPSRMWAARLMEHPAAQARLREVDRSPARAGAPGLRSTPDRARCPRCRRRCRCRTRTPHRPSSEDGAGTGRRCRLRRAPGARHETSSGGPAAGDDELTPPTGCLASFIQPQYVCHGMGVRHAMHCGRPRRADSHHAGCSSTSDRPCVAAYRTVATRGTRPRQEGMARGSGSVRSRARSWRADVDAGPHGD